MRTRLAPVLDGRRFEHVEISDPRLVRPFDPAEVAAELVGERVAAVERRGKYLIVRFESGRALLIHLRMTGSLRHGGSGLGDDPHRRAVVRLDDGSDVAYRDVRRFGTWLLLEPGELEPYLAREGRRRAARGAASPPPGSASASRSAARRSRPRSSTSARSPASGTSTSTRRSGARGSIRCDPRRASTATSCAGCTTRIRAALEHGIARQGSTLRDYALPDGSRAARCRTSSRCTAAAASRATAAARRSRSHASAVAARGSARPASRRRLRRRGARRAGRRGRGARARCSRRSARRRSGSAARSSRPSGRRSAAGTRDRRRVRSPRRRGRFASSSAFARTQ